MTFTCCLLVVACVAGGCQQRTVGELLGDWEGRPDTAAARAEREAEKYGKRLQASDDAPAAGGEQPAEAATDWEQYDVTLRMKFVNHDQLEISLDGDPNPVEGTWKVISVTPAECTIEVETPGGESLAEDASPEVVRRRFQLTLDRRDGECVGFVMREAGADRGLGAIYFRRATAVR